MQEAATAATAEWLFRIPLAAEDESDRVFSSSQQEILVPNEIREVFLRDGFVVAGHLCEKAAPSDKASHSPGGSCRGTVLSVAACRALNQRLEEILRGRYNRGAPPDKAPRLLKNEYHGSPHIHATPAPRIKTKPHQSLLGPIGFSGNRHNVRVIQVINVQKADALYWKLACSPILGQVVAQLAGWTKHGVRLASDQVWAKPPGAAPLAFHRDAPYFMFDPPDVVTVWIALDDMDDELGPLQYVRGSHLWEQGRVGTASQFFQSNGGIALLKSAAAKELQTNPVSSVGEEREEWYDIVSMAGLPAGGLSIHNGLTWHGSGKNMSPCRPRRGLGLHFVPAKVRFTAEAMHSSLWRSYVQDALSRNENLANVEVPLADFPITWQPDQTSEVT
jgi:ectoine hydroxylase-related dioxygenase (phytanoyl-CoA dioxygenase family)